MDVKVKSAARALQILDFFDEIEREASVNEIAHELKIPVSSTSVLLNQMFEMGYLNRGKGGRSYIPSVRVTTLGIWIDPTLGADGPVMRIMQELARATSELVILATARGDTVRYIHTIPATGRVRVHTGAGTSLPLALSCVGRMFMATMPERAVREVVFRHNQRAGASKPLVLAEVLQHLAEIRRRGYARSPEAVIKGVSGLAIALPPCAGPEPMVLAIGALSHTIEARYREWSKLMMEGIESAFADSAASARVPAPCASARAALGQLTRRIS